MSTSENLRAMAVQVTERELIVVLADGSRHAVPLGLFPILAEATPGEKGEGGDFTFVMSFAFHSWVEALSGVRTLGLRSIDDIEA